MLRRFRLLEPDGLAYCGFGFHSRQLNPALERIGWAPPKVMNAAIMWALAGPDWMQALDGWVGIEQTNNDHDYVEKNPNWVSMLDRFKRRFASRPPTPDGPGLTIGLERIKMMPSTLGGPGTYIGFGPSDHRGYRGDFMFMKQLRDGKFYFDAYHRPRWPIDGADVAVDQ